MNSYLTNNSKIRQKHPRAQIRNKKRPKSQKKRKEDGEKETNTQTKINELATELVK